MKKIAALFSYVSLSLLLLGAGGVALAQTGTLVTIIGGNQEAVNVTDNALDVNVVGGGGGGANVVSVEYEDLTGFDGGTAFTVTGVVKGQIIGVVGGTAIESTSGTTEIKVGTAVADGVLSGVLDNSAFTVGSVWLAGISEPSSDMAAFDPSAGVWFINSGADIVITVDTDDITQGSLTLYCLWEEVEPGATVTAAGP